MILRAKSKSISTREFKDKTFSLYESWKTEIESVLRELGVDDTALSTLNDSFEHLYMCAKSRVAYVSMVKLYLSKINEIFLNKIITTLKKTEEREPYTDLVGFASFLGLDDNWFLAVCALQLQEVAITLFAKHRNIKLDREHVEAILNRKVSSFTFNERYEALSKEVKRLYNVDMPILTTQFRRIRGKILHGGYNPEPEEKEAIVRFTLGLLQKLRSISCEK